MRAAVFRRRSARAAVVTFALAIPVLLGGCGRTDPEGPIRSGRLVHAGSEETSGITPSSRSTDLFWTHGDSSGQPLLYAVSKDGALQGTLRIQGVKNLDWEDISSFKLNDRSWLLVADTGNNNGARKNCSLLVVAEPDPKTLSPAAETKAAVEWTIPVVFPDGPHDCEAVSVQATEKRVYLISKRTTPPTVYALPLEKEAQPADGKARLVGPLAGVPQPNGRQKILPVPTGRYRGQVTALAFAPGGDVAAVLTYGDTLLYVREPGENWGAALARAPQILAPHDLPQAEAICFTSDGLALLVTGEENKPVLLRYKLKRHGL